MSELKYMAMDLSASLWYKPARFKELYKRGVIKNVSEHSFDMILKIALNKGWIYEKGGLYYCYKETVKKVLNPEGYGIDLCKEQKSEFRKQFEKYSRGF